MYWLSLCAVMVAASPCSVKANVEYVYHNHSALTDYLMSVNNTHSHLAYLYQVGTSIEGSV